MTAMPAPPHPRVAPGRPRLAAARARRVALAAVLALPLALPAPVRADTPAREATGVAPTAVATDAPPAVAKALGSPRLAGDGELRWFGLRVYTAQLWVGPQGLRPARLEADPFALQLRYAMGLKGAAIAQRSDEEIARLGLADAPRRARWLADMQRLFPDVNGGDRLTGVHQPGKATRFYLNDRPIGSIDDPAFGPAFFAIWLDARTVAPKLRDSLLRGAEAIRP